MFLLIVFNIFLESLDPLDIEDYLAEILSNEFNIIIEDGSLVKVLAKSRHYKERQVDRKKRKAIRRCSSAFVMGAMFLASALNRGSHPDCKVLFLRGEQKISSNFLRGSGTETSVSKPVQTDT